MPQFDTFSFLSQLFWLFSSFSLILFFLNYYLLPVISTTLKVRNSVLSFDFSSPWKADFTLSFLNSFLKINLEGLLTVYSPENADKNLLALGGNFLLENIFGNIFFKKFFQKFLNSIASVNS